MSRILGYRIDGVKDFGWITGGQMNAIIYTKDDMEYDLFKAILEREARLVNVKRAQLNGHKRYDHEYDVAVIALEGAEGMEVVLEYAQRFPDTRVIWVTSDPFFAGVAMRNHIYDFIQRPYEEDRLIISIRDVIERCPNRNVWRIPPGVERKKSNAV